MKRSPSVIVLALIWASLAASDARAVDVAKTNSMKVYMHYMPWFDAPAAGGTNWGIHWKMDTRNPNIVDATGKRQIASHYYPMIGPYESADADVIEYHLLLMKYAGIDGILIDWYGSRGSNGDVGSLLVNSNAIVNKTDEFGMKFAVTAEDNFWSTVTNNVETPDITKAKDSFKYLKDNYFNRPEYIRMGAGDDPLVTIFGPQTFKQPAQWAEILAEAGEDVAFLPLRDHSNFTGAHDDGEFAWVQQDANTSNHLTKLSSFYVLRAPVLDLAGGAAYPGFHDYYAEGGWGSGYSDVPSSDGATLQETLDLATQYSNRIDFLQLATWNDFGEGTMIEPTVENGFSYLRKIQQFTGVSYDEDELQLVYRLYLARKKYAGDEDLQATLDQVAELLTELQISQGRDLLNSAAPSGDFDGDGDVDAGDFNFWKTSFGSRTIVYGTGADGNFDGVVDSGDYVVWRDQLEIGAAAAAQAAASVPEPSAGVLITLAAGTLVCHHWSLLGRARSR